MVRPGLAFNRPYSAVYFGIKSDSVGLVVLNPDIVFKLIYELHCLSASELIHSTKELRSALLTLLYVA